MIRGQLYFTINSRYRVGQFCTAISLLNGSILDCHNQKDEFEPFYADDTVSGTSFIYHFKNCDKPREFIVVQKLIRHDKDGQLFLFPRYSLQAICHNQMDMDPKEVWEDYNKRAKIELTIRDLDYNHYITNVPTGKFLSNFAYFWFCVLSYNLILLFKNFVLAGDWSQFRHRLSGKNF